MSRIEQQLRLIREGAVTESSDFNEDAPSQAVLEAVYELFMIETSVQGAILTEAGRGIPSFSSLIMEAQAAVAEKDLVKAKGVFTIIAASIRDHLRSFVPSEAISELEVVNAQMRDRWSSLVLTFIPFGAIILLFAKAFKMKNLDPILAKKYLEEAEEFKKNLQKAMKQATTEKNPKLANKLEKQYRELEKAIAEYRHAGSFASARGAKSGV